MKKGHFISFEGGDGSGKTTQMEKTKKYIEDKKNYDVIITREPGGTEISEKIRKILLDKSYHKVLNYKTELFLYIAARTQLYYEKIKPLLKKNKVILCDRFYDATLAYQGYARNLGIDKTLELNLWALDGFKPDFTFLFMLDPETGLKRENNKDRFNLEGLKFHRKVCKGYKKIAKRFNNRIHQINVEKRNQDEVFEIIKSKLEKYL
ncbi:MAG: dTMP kinase [Candidatus Mcinerneyibacterium aminivorans]|uniref:Thymidylate kinase n=1 Tax=Candidatus Mcinerneyibacterium aminivorans TaxID=2703815 RepID=A0A5D0MGV2_9BACT|nr:MAG: dTMP kinase [Candidatus Mcinerneyibacterium aminivorans]